MAIVEINELKLSVAGHHRLLGIDVGSKTLGLALSDLSLTVATPLKTIKRTKFASDAEQLKLLVYQHDVGGLLLGLPVSMDGTEGPKCQSVRQFAANLLNVLDLPLAFWDERLSTAAVERVLIAEADMSRKRRRDVIDKAAAAYILQGALDAIDMRRAGPAP
jgi:putative Holliday junction resolvase